jgi:hypothetical protein
MIVKKRSNKMKKIWKNGEPKLKRKSNLKMDKM